MTRKNDTGILSIVHPICCGLDVHKRSISACLLIQNESGQINEEIREFETFTDVLYELKAWLIENNCPVAAIESTGVYWQPVHNILEDSIEVVLVNARHVKNVPGRKTDISDAVWLASLLRHGLLRGSFIPTKEVRQWRQLWSMRISYVETLGDFKRRVHKHLQSCNIKIDSVAAVLFSVTGRNLMELLLTENEEITLEQVEQCTRRGLKAKTQELYLSIKGFMGEHERFVLSSLLDMIRILEIKIEQINDRMKSVMGDHEEVIARLDQVPGINEIGAMGILAIIGPDLSAFPKPSNFCSWAGLSPGNNKSAGKRKSGRNSVRKHPLRTLLVELSWASIKKKNSYYRDKYFRLKSRIGPKPAIFAIAHRVGKAVYHIINHKQDFLELGDQYLDQRNQKAKLNRIHSQALKMGYNLVPLAETE